MKREGGGEREHSTCKKIKSFTRTGRIVAMGVCGWGMRAGGEVNRRLKEELFSPVLWYDSVKAA